MACLEESQEESNYLKKAILSYTCSSLQAQQTRNLDKTKSELFGKPLYVGTKHWAWKPDTFFNSNMVGGQYWWGDGCN